MKLESWYNIAPTTLSFKVDLLNFRVACYFVDYNTEIRSQNVSVWLDDKPHNLSAIKLEGEEFRNGQWVVWEIKSSQFNISVECNNDMTPNWVFSAMMFDEITENNTNENVSFIHIDNKTRGNWIGTYGESGGIIFGENDICISPFSLNGVITCSPNVERYTWQYLPNDIRALQAQLNFVNVKPLKKYF